MYLCLDEINALEHLVKLSGQTWFSIRSPSFIWDNENNVRMSVKDGVKEFLSCVEGSIKKLDADELIVIRDLWDAVNKETEFVFVEG